MAGLRNIIRLHEWTVDERRRELGLLLRDLGNLEQRIVDLEAEIVHEQKLAAAAPDTIGRVYGAYHERAMERREEMDALVLAKEREIEDAREVLAGAYMELKKYEIAQEVRDEEEAEEDARRDQLQLDEMALQQYRQKKKRA